ncbi:uncharacterized protein ATNIH1004_010571 [Aspergillus tanneri]|uniref:Uncharacterized protein n=1 Tax=Aspergillus tanneri TaxID=1220188 RepID=A0A5M9MM33_9EURO|nr:uncharacterized protein ATNIH1004_010571 [Aspergillus tanneri]KAA8643797.1 hypothetical protein ATNIH1004_010571 [Aspergillus tanneri]
MKMNVFQEREQSDFTKSQNGLGRRRASKSLEQLDKLLLQPLPSLELASDQSPTLAIVIDALDECERGLAPPDFLDEQTRIANQFGFSQRSQAVNIMIWFYMNDKDRPVPTCGLAWRQCHSISCDNFGSIVHFCCYRVPYIRSPPVGSSVNTLAEILAHRNDGSQLDGIYLPVLNRLLKGQSKKQEKQPVQEFQEIVGAIVMLESPLSVISLSKFPGPTEGQIDWRLDSLHSVLSMPVNLTQPVRLFHLSFRDYLLDLETRDRTPLRVDEKQMHQRLTARSLYRCDSLRRNMCRLSDGTKRAEIHRRSIDHYLSPELQYSCRYWAYHLTKSKDPIAEMDNVFSFLQKHFLHCI